MSANDAVLAPFPKPFPFPKESIGGPRTLGRVHKAEASRFEIHREEEVSVTSTLFCGGDWQWRLCSAAGDILAEAGGFESEGACRTAIAAIKADAGLASVQLAP